jgi:DNA polymerase I
MKDGGGAYNRYFGRLSDGSIKIRGIAARRHDTPAFIRSMQDRMLTTMARATNIAELDALREEVRAIHHDAVMQLPDADPREMKIERRISRTTYAHRCIEGGGGYGVPGTGGRCCAGDED